MDYKSEIGSSSPSPLRMGVTSVYLEKNARRLGRTFILQLSRKVQFLRLD